MDKVIPLLIGGQVHGKLQRRRRLGSRRLVGQLSQCLPAIAIHSRFCPFRGTGEIDRTPDNGDLVDRFIPQRSRFYFFRPFGRRRRIKGSPSPYQTGGEFTLRSGFSGGFAKMVQDLPDVRHGYVLILHRTGGHQLRHEIVERSFRPGLSPGVMFRGQT